MNWYASTRRLFEIVQADHELSRDGLRLGWLTTQYLRSRFAARLGHDAPLTRTTFTVAGRKVRVEMTAAHYPVALGVFVVGEYDLRGVVAEPPRTILDLGANVGMASAYLDAIFPGARYICVEPDPRNLKLLRSNIRHNRLPAEVVSKAVGAYSGELSLHIGPDPAMTAAVGGPVHPGPGSYIRRVRMTTVPEICEQYNLSRIDLLKIDIEGAEQDLLCRNNGWLARVGTIVLELHTNISPEEVQLAIGPYGFRLSSAGCRAAPIYLAIRDRPAGS